MVSIIEGVKINIVLSTILAFIFINWEYNAINQTKILGLIIAIVNPWKKELELILYVLVSLLFFFIIKIKPRISKKIEPQIWIKK